MRQLRSKKIYRGLLGVALLALSLSGTAQAQGKGTTNPTRADMVAAKSLGSKAAPIVMEVFSDYQCPACKTLYQDTLRPVIDNYVSAGKVYLIHRDMPLAAHKHAREAARYANAAARIGKFAKVEERSEERRVGKECRL